MTECKKPSVEEIEQRIKRNAINTVLMERFDEQIEMASKAYIDGKPVNIEAITAECERFDKLSSTVNLENRDDVEYLVLSVQANGLERAKTSIESQALQEQVTLVRRDEPVNETKVRQVSMRLTKIVEQHAEIIEQTKQLFEVAEDDKSE